jgi:hypothetical protein
MRLDKWSYQKNLASNLDFTSVVLIVDYAIIQVQIQ